MYRSVKSAESGAEIVVVVVSVPAREGASEVPGLREEIVHRESREVPGLHEEIVHRENREVPGLHGQWESVQLARRVVRDLPRDPRPRVPPSPTKRLHLHLRRQARLRAVLLRASRGDLESCYWHRHDLNIVNNIAVA